MSIDWVMDKEAMVYAGGILVSQKQECNNAICIKADECRDYHTKLDMSEKKQIYTCGI